MKLPVVVELLKKYQKQSEDPDWRPARSSPGWPIRRFKGR